MTVTTPPASTRPHPRIAVVRVGGQFHVMADADIAPGITLLRADGPVVDRPSRHSIQIAAAEHVDPPAAASLQEEMDRYPWRFLNHSCAANAAWRGRRLVATRPIRRFEQVTFDYTTTEFDMAGPFVCSCGAVSCLGEIRGYRYLTEAQRARIAPFVAEHLRHFPG